MMKLKHLFDNRPLAEMIVRNWDFDEPSLEMFKYFRISANAIYPFKLGEQVRILRFSHVEEKPRESILAELELLRYLRGKGYNALECIPSKKGEELVTARTPWGDYNACVFARVPGTELGRTALDDEIMHAFGASLGDLHTLSRAYHPERRRWSHEDVLVWVETVLKGLPGKDAALREVGILRTALARLPKTSANYGLIHYDFELDNVFWDPAGRACHVIDFDDAMYHWYAMDVAQTLDSIEKDAPEERKERLKELFLQGYRSRFDSDNAIMENLHLFLRFTNLYGYARVARSESETWENEPEWMTGLRKHWAGLSEARAGFFGEPVK